MIQQLNHEQKRTLVAAARAAVCKSFLTNEGGVRYGAAVLTLQGRIHKSGQYSSFNHSTNVHAEQASLVIATMLGDPDVVAMAVASTKSDETTRPCGVCRQVMLEHATRTGRDFLVLMAHQDGSWEEQRVSELLPFSWVSAKQTSTGSAQLPLRKMAIKPTTGANDSSASLRPRMGDQVAIGKDLLAIVWDPTPWHDTVLVKFKYRRMPDGRWRKFPHAFTQPFEYERELAGIEGLSSVPCGAPVATIQCEQIARLLPAIPATGADLPSAIADAIERAGINRQQVFLTGSVATGLVSEASDTDWLIRADSGSHHRLARLLAQAVCQDRLSIPNTSASCALLGRVFPGGLKAALADGRPPSAFLHGPKSHSIFPAWDEDMGPVHGSFAQPLGHASIEGVVEQDIQACVKRAGFLLRHADGSCTDVACYHKLGNLVRTGDRIAVRGWLMSDEGRHVLIQFHPHRDNIVWFSCNRPSQPFSR